MSTQSLGAIPGLLAMKLSGAMGQDIVLTYSKLGALHNPLEFLGGVVICHLILNWKGRQF